jgi:tetratricopeptide (TPR) repeat protein
MVSLFLKSVFSSLFVVLILVGGSMPAIAAVSQPAAPSKAAAQAEELPTSAASTQPSALDLFQQLNALSNKAFEASNAGDFQAAEGYWTEILERFPDNAAVWSNRGNTRVGQNKLLEAIADFNKAIELAPNAPDSYLNRGAALEGLGKWQEAIADYNHVLEINPQDPAAFNNRGNAKAGLGEWESALADFKQAGDLVGDFAFARANYALTIYQLDQTEEAIRNMQHLVRKYPQFADMRAALTAAFWAEGKQGEAESQWVSAVGLDARYKEIDWVKNVRRWPPKMAAALEKFLTLK